MSANDEQRGYKYTIIHAGARKADFNPHTPLTEEARAAIETELNRTYGMLVKAVARNRGMSESAIRDTEAGRYFGDEAIPMGLADRMGTKASALSDLRQAVARPTISIPRGGKKVMAEETVNIEAIRADAHRQGYAEAREIVELCALAGMPGRAAALLAANASAAEARQQLMEARAAEGAVEIRSHVMPDTGTQARTSSEDGPVMKAVQRLTVKGVN